MGMSIIWHSDTYTVSLSLPVAWCAHGCKYCRSISACMIDYPIHQLEFTWSLFSMINACYSDTLYWLVVSYSAGTL